MRAMILAAGRGERMRELTTHVPKPLLKVAGKHLIEYAIDSLSRANINEIVINVSYHGAQIKHTLGDGRQYNVRIHYSEEPERLETGGGILQALPYFGGEPFIVVSGDVISDYPFAQLTQHRLTGLAHLVMVANPEFHPEGDFGLNDQRIDESASPKLTYANIGIYHPQLFEHCTPGYFPLKQVLYPAIKAGKVSGEIFKGKWYNIGTPADLMTASAMLATSSLF